MKTTIIKAYDNEDKGTPQSIFIFVAVHTDEVEAEASIKSAFKDWAATPDGAEFIDEEGTNWGDALNIPQEFLEKYGVTSLEPAATADHEIVVDHNESLV